MKMQPSIVSAVCARNFKSYFNNPVGYLFICAFTVACGWFAFNDQFFAANMADLEQLNLNFPYLLLLLVPAIAMSAWAEERRSGTEELLLTLPGSDWSIVLGKYFACVGIYTVAVLFSMIYVVILAYLAGSSGIDWGLTLSNYFGYWLVGSALLATAMVASLLTPHTTVAFILGALLCGIVVGAARIDQAVRSAGLLFTGTASDFGALQAASFGRLLHSTGLDANFQPVARGLIGVSSIVYFVALVVLMLYVNVFLLGRRHWGGGKGAGRQWLHGAVRIVSGLVLLVSLHVFARRLDPYLKVDATAERLYTLSKETIDILKNIDPGTEVRVDAFIAPLAETPRDYMETHRNLRDLLERYDSLSGGKVKVNIVETEVDSAVAQRAEKNFGVKAAQVPVQEDGKFKVAEFVLGVSARAGKNEATIPFLHKGLGVEYELSRLIRTVASPEPPRIAVLSTDANMLDRFGTEERDWRIVADLRKQYRVLRAQPGQLMQREEPKTPEPPKPGEPPPARKLKRNEKGEALVSDSIKDAKVLIVALPSSLSPDELDDLLEYVKSGRPTMLLEDTLPVANPDLRAGNPMKGGDPQMAMFGMNRGMQPKGDFKKLLALLNVEMNVNGVVWQTANPLRQGGELAQLAPEIVTAGKNVIDAPLYAIDHPITAAMRKYVVFIYGGAIAERGGDGPKLTRLLWTAKDAGMSDVQTLMSQRNPTDTDQKRKSNRTENTLAALIEGKPAKDALGAPPAGEKVDEPKEIKVIMVADMDFIGDQFFNFRQSGDSKKFDFENVEFLINCVDYLAGDEALIPLRQKRPTRRNLNRIVEIGTQFQNDTNEAIEKATAEAENARREAQKQLDEATKDLIKDGKIKVGDIVEFQRRQEAAKRRFDVRIDEITQNINNTVRDAQRSTQEKIRGKQEQIRLFALLLPILPVLFVGLVVWWIRTGRETEGVSRSRLVS